MCYGRWFRDWHEKQWSVMLWELFDSFQGGSILELLFYYQLEDPQGICSAVINDGMPFIPFIIWPIWSLNGLMGLIHRGNNVVELPLPYFHTRQRPSKCRCLAGKEEQWYRNLQMLEGRYFGHTDKVVKEDDAVLQKTLLVQARVEKGCIMVYRLINHKQ